VIFLDFIGFIHYGKQSVCILPADFQVNVYGLPARQCRAMAGGLARQQKEISILQ